MSGITIEGFIGYKSGGHNFFFVNKSLLRNILQKEPEQIMSLPIRVQKSRTKTAIKAVGNHKLGEYSGITSGEWIRIRP
jgi:hypothetical protein